MLAIQCIKMYWTKANRTPEGSVMRRTYYAPAPIDTSVILEPKAAEYFVHRRFYVQTDKVYTNTDYNQQYGNRYINAAGSTETKQQERKRQFLLEQNRMEQDNLGVFYSDTKAINIPGIKVVKEVDTYRIRWYSLENGYQPVRRGYNEQSLGSNIRCETAFVLEKGKSGKIEYNYRYTSYHRQHYEQYYIYFIHTKNITSNSFVKANYEKVYTELADLF